MGEKDSQLCLLSVTWRLERNSEPKSLNLAGGVNYDVWPSRPPLSISLSTADDDDQVWFFFTSSRSDHERGPFKLPFPLLLHSSHSCFVNRGSRIEQLQDLFSTRRARVPTRPTACFWPKFVPQQRFLTTSFDDCERGC